MRESPSLGVAIGEEVPTPFKWMNLTRLEQVSKEFGILTKRGAMRSGG